MKLTNQRQADGAKKALKSGIVLGRLTGLKAITLARWIDQGHRLGLFYLPGAQLWGIGPTDPYPREVKLYRAPQLLAELVRSFDPPRNVRIFQKDQSKRTYYAYVAVAYKVSSLLKLLSLVDLVDLYALPLLVRKAVATQRIINELEN